MRYKIVIKRKLDEMSGVGAVGGFAGGFGSPSGVGPSDKDKSNKDALIRLEDGGAGIAGRMSNPGMRTSITGDEEHEGQVEKAKYNCDRNIMEDDSDLGELEDSFVDTFSYEIGTDQALRTAEDDSEEAFVKPLRARGYEVIKYISEGAIGKVFLVEDINTGGEYAAKVVGLLDPSKAVKRSIPDTIRKEVGNYSEIKNIGNTVEDVEKEKIWRHFPEVYDAWVEVNQDIEMGFIIMELLVEAEAEETVFIPDVNDAVAKKYPKRKESAYEFSDFARDQSLKAKVAFKDLYEVFAIVQDLIKSIMEEVDKKTYKLKIRKGAIKNKSSITSVMKSIYPRVLSRYEKMQDSSPEKIAELIRKRTSEILGYLSRAQDFQKTMNILNKEVSDAPYIILIFLEFSLAMAKIGELSGKSSTDDEVDDFGVNFLNIIRKTTGVKSGYRSRELKGRPENSHSLGNDLYAALVALYDATGLAARDIHDRNVMKRPGSGDLVVVDLGLFMKDKNWVGLK